MNVREPKLRPRIMDFGWVMALWAHWNVLLLSSLAICEGYASDTSAWYFFWGAALLLPITFACWRAGVYAEDCYNNFRYEEEAAYIIAVKQIIEKYERGCASDSHLWMVDEEGQVKPGTPCKCMAVLFSKERGGFVQ